MEKERIVNTQIRLGEDIYEYANEEANRLAISMNAALNGLIDDGRRWRKATVTVQMKEQ